MLTRVRDKKVSKKVGNLANILYLYSMNIKQLQKI